MIVQTDAEIAFARNMVHACVLGSLFLFSVALNIDHFVKRHRASTPEEKQDVHAPSPLLGGIFGAIALLIIPLPGFSKWWWIPFVIDPGSAFLVLSVLNTYFFHIGGIRPIGEKDQRPDQSSQNHKEEN